MRVPGSNRERERGYGCDVASSDARHPVAVPFIVGNLVAVVLQDDEPAPAMATLKAILVMEAVADVQEINRVAFRATQATAVAAVA